MGKSKNKDSEPGCLTSLFGLVFFACIIVLIVDLIENKISSKTVHNLKIAAIIIGILFVVYLIFSLYRKFNKKYSIKQLDNMDGHRFEYACADILRSNGFKNVKVTQGSGDFGVDIIASKNGLKYAVQCKCYSNKLNNKPIQEVIGGMAYYNCSKGAVMTNQYFTEPARELARVNNIELWDRDILISKSSKCKKDKTKKVSGETSHEIISDDMAENSKKEVNPEQQANMSEISDSNLLWQAIDLILTTGNASTAFLQRKLRLGFPRAARTMDEIEEMGIIGPQGSSNPREIYYTVDDLPLLHKKFADTYPINAEEEKRNINLNSDSVYKYAVYSTTVTNIEKNQKIYKDFITAVTDSIIKYFVELQIDIYLIKTDIKYETNEVVFEFSLEQYTSVSKVKPHIKSLAKYVGVKYSEFVYPTSTPYTIGIKMPLPEYLKETSTLIYKLNKEDEK